MLTYFCYNNFRPPVLTFNACMIDTGVRSNMPIVCACFVMACFKKYPGRRVVSLITWDVDAVRLSERSVVGKEACLVMMLKLTLAIALASWLDVGYVNKKRENTSLAVTIFSYPMDGCNSGTKSLCMASSGAKMRS